MAGRRAEEKTVRLANNGYLRLSPDLLPAMRNGKRFGFFIHAFPTRKVELTPGRNGKTLDGKTCPWPFRLALFSNDASRSMHVSVKMSLKFMGMLPPKDSIVYHAEKNEDGTVVVQF